MADIPYESLNNMQHDPQVDGMFLPEQVAVSFPGLKKREMYRRKLNGLGKAEIVLGVISCVLGIASLAIDMQNQLNHHISNYSILSPGIWCGILLLVSGILGIRARGNPSLCMYNANMTLSILASVAMSVQVAFSIMGALILLFYFPRMLTPVTSAVRARISIEIILSILGLVGMIISIIHSAYCCKGVCCLKSDFNGVLISAHGDVQQPQQVAQLANGQFVLVPTQGFSVSSPSEKVHPAYKPESCSIQEQVSTMQGIQMPPAVDNPPGYSNAHDSVSIVQENQMSPVMDNLPGNSNAHASSSHDFIV